VRHFLSRHTTATAASLFLRNTARPRASSRCPPPPFSLFATGLFLASPFVGRPCYPRSFSLRHLCCYTSAHCATCCARWHLHPEQVFLPFSSFRPPHSYICFSSSSSFSLYFFLSLYLLSLLLPSHPGDLQKDHLQRHAPNRGSSRFLPPRFVLFIRLPLFCSYLPLLNFSFFCCASLSLSHPTSPLLFAVL
jgi:hypothetical protein